MKPIILTTREIRGLLDGTISVIRREIKPQPPRDEEVIGSEIYTTIVIDKRGDEQPGTEAFGVYGDGWDIKCPFRPGEVLYCRESWHQCYDSTFRYAATDPPNKGWSSPATMPREAARLFLMVEETAADKAEKWDWVYKVKAISADEAQERENQHV